MLDHRLRAEFEKGIRPIGAGLGRSGFTADQITVAGLAVSLFTGVAIATGHFFWAAVGMALCGITDVLDGAVAKSHGTAGPRGAFFDSVCDRVSDALLLGGVAFHLSTVHPGRIAVLPLAVLALSMLISYERAKAESLGFEAKGGVMERAERLIALAIGLLFDVVLIPVLWLMLVLTAVTAVQRFVSVWKQASAPRPKPTPASARWRARRASRTTERVKARREREPLTIRDLRDRTRSLRDRRR